MKGSKLLIIIVSILTVALGGVAIWIGWRLSQEEEVTPEIGEAATVGTIVNLCGTSPASGNWDQHDAAHDANLCGCTNNQHGKDVGCFSAGHCYADFVRLSRCLCTLLSDDPNNLLHTPSEGSAWRCDNQIPGGGWGDYPTISFPSIFEQYANEGYPTECYVFQIDAEDAQCPTDFVVWKGDLLDQCPDQCKPTTTTTTTTTTTSTTTTTTTTTTTHLPPKNCGDTCSSSSQCPSGLTCPTSEGKCCKDCGDGSYSCNPAVNCGCQGTVGGRVLCKDETGTWAVKDATVDVYWASTAGGTPNLQNSTTDEDGYWILGDFQLSGAKVYIPSTGLSGASLISTTETKDVPQSMIDSSVTLAGNDCDDGPNTPCGGGTPCCSSGDWRCSNPTSTSPWRYYDNCWIGQPETAATSFNFTFTDCAEEVVEELNCDSLTADGDNSIVITQGESATASLLTTTSGTITNITYEYGATYGSVSGTTQNGTWSITSSQSSQLSAQTYNDAIWVYVSGDSQQDGGPGTACAIDLIVQEQERTLTCDDLVSAQGDPITVTRGQSTSVQLTTITSGNVSPITYNYSSSYGTIDGTGQSVLWTITIDQSTQLDPGTYENAIWVSISGGGLTRGGQDSVCSLDLNVLDWTCDCDDIQRSPDGNITNNSTVWLQIHDTCNLNATDVVWYWNEDGGDAQQTNFDNKTPATGSSYEHSIEFTVPATVTGEICIWAETEGIQDPTCRDCFTLAEEESPAFSAIKTSEVECIDNNTAARITYTITVHNISGVEGVIEYVQDTYDSKIQSSWVGSFSPNDPDTWTENILTWNNGGSGYTLTADDGSEGGSDETAFSYVVTVPSDYFGVFANGEFTPYQYENNAVVKPQNQQEIRMSTIEEITCIPPTVLSIVQQSPLPPTGKLDQAITAFLLAALLLFLGLITLYFIKTKEAKNIPFQKTEERANTFEKTIIDRINGR